VLSDLRENPCEEPIKEQLIVVKTAKRASRDGDSCVRLDLRCHGGWTAGVKNSSLVDNDLEGRISLRVKVFHVALENP